MKNLYIIVAVVVISIMSLFYLIKEKDSNNSLNTNSIYMPIQNIEPENNPIAIASEPKSYKTETIYAHQETAARPQTISDVNLPVMYQGEERIIGFTEGKGMHNPMQEIFNVELERMPTQEEEAYLEYELYGVADYTQVARSINNQPVFGGYFIKRWDEWTSQSEIINPSLLQKGKNAIRFTIADNAEYRYKIRNLKINIKTRTPNTYQERKLCTGGSMVSNTNEKTEARKLVVNQPTTAFYYKQYGFVEGFVSGKDCEQAQIRIGKQKVRNYKGEFEGMAIRTINKEEEVAEDDQPSNRPWSTKVEAVFPDGEILSVDLTFERPTVWDYEMSFNPEIHYAEESVSAASAFTMSLGEASLEGEAGAIKEATKLSITALRAIDFPRLNPGMVNVTAGYDGYRFLPHGSHFEQAVTLRLGYDSTKIPKGHTAKEIRSYYYDESMHYWVALPRDSVYPQASIVCSKTTHFTDIINAIVKVPEMPETKEFTPTSIKELKAADPSSGIQMIQPPSANNQGTASVSYPINVPAGRQGMQPNVAITYSSEGGNGLLGMGWDMQIPAISVDTKWGVPRYNDTYETESYIKDGEELLPSARLEATWQPRISNRRFYPRIENAFDSIVRVGNSPDNYFWVVTNKMGVKSYYGSYDGISNDPSVLLTDKNGNIAYWPLCKVEDLNGNYMIYCYTVIDQYDDINQTGQPPATGVYLGKQLWLEAITYTGNDTTEGAYRVIFASQDCSIDEAKMHGCNLDSGYTMNGYTGENTIEPLSETTTIDTKKTVLKEDIKEEDINKTPKASTQGTSIGTVDDCSFIIYDVKICMRDLLCDYNKIVGAIIEVGETEPEFVDNNPDPFPVISVNPTFKSCTTIANGDTCCIDDYCSMKKYYVVATPPNNCRVKDPVSFIMIFVTDGQGNLTDVTIDSVSGIPTDGANITVDIVGTSITINVPVECLFCHFYPPCDTCHGCDTCPTRYSCSQYVYFGAYDTLCTHKRVKNCNFTYQIIGDTHIKEFYTGPQGIHPFFIRCDTAYLVEGCYFGEKYQNTPISFKFRVDTGGNFSIWDVTGLQYPNNNILAKYYPNSDYFAFLMPVGLIDTVVPVRLEIKNQLQVAMPNYSFIIADKTTGLVVGDVKTTDGQGFTPFMDLLKGRTYHIHEIDATTYYNPNNSIPYLQLISEDVDVSFDVWVDFCDEDLITDPDYSNHTTGNVIVGYTITFILPDGDNKLYITKVDNFGIPVKGTIFSVKNIQTSQTANYTTGNRGHTDEILVDNSTDYVIQETYVPTGYVLDTQSIYISIDANGMVSNVTSARSVQSGIYNGSQHLIVANEKEYLYFKIKKVDAVTHQVLEGCKIAIYLPYDKYGPNYPSTGSDGYTYEMKMEFGKSYFIREQEVPYHYDRSKISQIKITVGMDGRIEVSDTSYVLPGWEQDEEGVYIFTFVNYYLEEDTIEPLNPKEGCDEIYAYDKRINTRYGFLQSSKEKLSKIVILYKDSCVRTYSFCYGEDFFKRAQLQEINQWNSTDTGVPYTHYLEYYEETTHGQLLKAKESSTHEYEGLSTGNPKTGASEKLAKIFKELTIPSLMGSNSTWAMGLNGGADIGLFPDFPLKTLSGGLYFNGGVSFGKGKATLMDINGDGLPDQIFNKLEVNENKVYYCLQDTNNIGSFGSPIALTGVKQFLSDFSYNLSGGISASALAHGSIQKGLSQSWTTVFFTDLNGDGLLEQVNLNGVKHIGSIQPPPTFDFGECGADPRIIQPKTDLEVLCDTNFKFRKVSIEQDRTDEIRYDVVRVWKSHYSECGYDLFAPVWLEEDTEAANNFCGEEDAVIVSIEYYGTGLSQSLQHIVLWSDTIAGSDTMIHCEGRSWYLRNTNIVDTFGIKQVFYKFDTLRFDKYDLVFFRVRPWKNGVKKKVVWDPQILPNRCSQTWSMLDENGRYLAGGNKASESQLLQGDSVFYCPVKGNVTVDYEITTPLFSDTVCFEFWHNNTLKDSYTIIGNSTTLPFQAFTMDVDSTDILKFKVMCGSNVNMHDIEWTPRLYYHNMISQGDTVNAIIRDTVNGIADSVLLLEYHLSPWHEFYSKQLFDYYEVSAIVPDQPMDDIQQITITGYAHRQIKDTARITIKQEGSLLYSRDIILDLQPGNIYYVLNLNDVVDLDDTKVAYLSCYFNDPNIGLDITSVLLKINNMDHICIMYTKEPHHVIYGDLYERWGQFLYLTDTIPNTDMLALMDVSKMEDINNLDSVGFSNFVDTISMGDTITDIEQYAINNYTARLNELRNKLICLPMFNDEPNHGHVGIYPNTYIRGADINLGGFPCPDIYEDQEEPCVENPYSGESGSSGGGSGSGSSGPISAAEIASYGLSKKTSGKNISYSVGFSIPGFSVGESKSTGTSIMKDDMMDLNGDGFPDLLRSGYVYYSYPKALAWEDPKEMFGDTTGHHKSVSESYGKNFTADPVSVIKLTSNAGKGKTTQTKSKSNYSPNISMSGSTTYSIDNTENTLIDINGDGLPDKVYKSGLVALNLGYSFYNDVKWNGIYNIGCYKSNASSISLGGSLSGDFSGGDKSFCGGLSYSKSYNQTNTMLSDINGDGLPDKILIVSDSIIYVFYNTGCGISNQYDSITLTDFQFYNWNTTNSMSTNFGLTFGFSLGPYAKISASGGADLSYSLSASNIQFMDMDADGIVDLVFTPDETTLAICYSKLGRTGLLKTIVNPMGGTIDMAYHKTAPNEFYSRRWVLDTIIVDDNIDDNGEYSTMTIYDYEYGYYDRKERVFNGFAKVTENQYQGNDLYRRTERYYRNDSVTTKGLLTVENIMNGDSIFYIYKKNTYQLQTPDYGSDTSHRMTVFPALVRTLTCYFEGDENSTINQEKLFTYGAYGNVSQQSITSTSMDTVVVNITYHPQQNDNYCVGIPMSVEVAGYRKRETTVNNKGQYTQIKDYYDANNYLSTAMEYDNFGNCTRIVYPNSSYSYVYDSEVHTYPVSVRDTFGHTSYAQDYDFRYGIPLKIISKDSAEMHYTIDNWGRLLTIRGPKEIDSNVSYTIRYQYNNAVIDTDTYVLLQPASTYTFNYDPEYPTNDIHVYTYSDGLGRILQVKKDAEVDGVEKMVVSGREIYDAFGRKVETYYPTIQDPQDTVYFSGKDVTVSPSTTEYDILDRPLQQDAPDGSYQTYSYYFGQDGLGHVLFKTQVIDQNGHPSIVLKDVDGLQWAMKPAGEEWVYFAYDKMGQCDSVFSSQANDFTRSYSYDRLGRKTAFTEGNLHEEYSYTGANLTNKKMEWYNSLTSNQDYKEINYDYNFNRLTSMHIPGYAMPTEYVYDDALAHGKLVAIKDESGIQTFEYGSMGEVVKSTRAYALPTQAQPIAFSTRFTYDSWGRMKNITYPDGEVLTYSYDRGGQLKKMLGVKDNYTYNYLDSMNYDKFGAKTLMLYGNNVKTTYAYNPNNLRLTNISTAEQQNEYSTMDYTYDYKGNVTQLVSNYTWYSNNDPITQTFVYDSTDQLVSALGEVNQTSMYSVNVSYGNWGKIGGYTTSMNGTDTFMYPTTNLTSTHFAPESSVNNGQTTNYDFGINGSLRRKENNEATEYYLFNAFNCMKAYSYNAERYGYYGYDASGERTYKMDINFLGVWTNELEEISDNWEMEKMMLYPNGYLNMNQNGEYTKHYYADALRIASKIGRGFDGNICDSVIEIENDYPNYLDDRMTDQNTIMMSELYETTQLASPQGSLHFVNPYPDLCNLQGNAQETELFYYHPDHLGSTGMVTDRLSNITAGYLYAPFGEILQEHLAVDNRIPKYAFNAKELDEENGMYYYSARYYAPPTFISRDPMFEKYPSISPYTYCANNPMKYVDPTGKTLEEGDGDPPPGMLFINQKKITPPLATNSGENGTATNSPPKPSSSSKPTVTNTTTSNSSPSKPTQSPGTGQATMKDFYRQQLKEATGLDKNMEYAIRYVAESMGLPSEKDVINAVAPILEGAVLFNPLVGVPNGVYTAVAGEDIYGNEASTANRIISGVGVVAGGVSNVAIGTVSTIAKRIDRAIDVWTGIQTTREGYKKTEKQ